MNSATTLAALVAHCRKLTRRLQTTHASLASKLILAAMPLVMAGVLGFGAFRTLPAEPPRENLARAKDSASKSPAAERAESRLDRFGDPLPPGAIRRFGTVRFRHHDLFDVAFTPDGKQLIVGDGCSPLAVFDAITGRKLREVGKSTRGANSLTGFALSPDGKQVVCCGSDVFVWDLATGRLIRQLHCGLSREVAFTSDGARLAAAVKETSRGAITGIVVVEAASGKHMANWTVLNQQEIEQNRFYSISFSPDGKFLAGLFSQLREEKPAIHKVYTSKVWLLDAATGKRIRIFGSDDIPVVSFAFQPNTGRLATFGKDGILRFWDVETGKEVQQFPAAKGTEGNSFGALRFSADGRRCAVLTDRGKFITVLDTKEGRLVRRVEEEESRMRVALALSPDGKAIASARLYDASCVRVCEVDSGIERLANAGHRAAPTALSLSSDSRTLLSRDERGREYIRDLRSGKGITRSVGVREVVGDFIWSSDFSHKSLRGPRWRLVYKNQRPAMMEVWSLDGKKLIRKAEAHGPMVPTVALSPDGAHLALTARNVNNANSTVMLWNPERDEKPRALPSKPDGFSQLLFSHDGKKLIGRAGWGNPRFSTGSVWIWDVATTRLLHKLPINTAPGHLQLTTDDRVLLLCGLGNDATVHAWDLESGQELARLTDPALKPPNDSDNYRTQPAITGLAPSADGRFLAVVTS